MTSLSEQQRLLSEAIRAVQSGAPIPAHLERWWPREDLADYFRFALSDHDEDGGCDVPDACRPVVRAREVLDAAKAVEA